MSCKVETVSIHIPTGSSTKTPDAPVRVSNRNKEPVTTNFKFIPKYMPLLSTQVKDVSWNCAAKTFDVQIIETPNFDSFNWFDGINKRLAEAQKNAFVDLELDSLILVFQDESKKDVAMLKFRGLELIDHYCYLSEPDTYMFDVSDDPQPLVHSIKIRYSDSTTIPIDSREFARVCDENEHVDEEWQTV